MVLRVQADAVSLADITKDHLCTGKMLDINIEPVVPVRPLGVAIEKY